MNTINPIQQTAEPLQKLPFATDDYDIIFAVSDASLIPAEFYSQIETNRISLQIYECSNCLLIKHLAETDLLLIQQWSSIAFVVNPHGCIEGFSESNLIERLIYYRFKIFFSFSASASVCAAASRYALISVKEFVLSIYSRLLSYPLISHYAVRFEHNLNSKPVKALFILDLIQDFEILKPILLRASLPFSPLAPVVAISNRVIKYGSYLMQAIMNFIETFNIPWFNPAGPVDIANALGNSRALLITASESNAAGHIMCHQACLIAPPKTTRITIQHGYECVGLRHHRAHDYVYKSEPIRFASDVVLTWSGVDNLPNLHPLERHKCIPVGVVKQLTEEASMLNEWLLPGFQASADVQPRPTRLLLAENLHSVRFSSPSKYNRLLNFINDANDSDEVELTIRSHPAKRTLESNKEHKSQYGFLEGLLLASRMNTFNAIISPPSTILLDAVITGVPTLVWSESKEAGDCVNYDGLADVADFNDFLAFAPESFPNQCEQNYAWALRNTSALNGIPAAWQAIVNLSR